MAAGAAQLIPRYLLIWKVPTRTRWTTWPLRAICMLLAAYTAPLCGAPSMLGQTGLINMPDGRTEEDGVWRFGSSLFDPYWTLWTSLSMFSRVEVSGRYTEIQNVPSGLGDDFGDFKDKAFDAKGILLPETSLFPSVALGAQDILGTQKLSAQFLALSKRIGDFDLTLGYGRDRIDGLFGGARYSPRWFPNLALVAEYDSNDYQNDFRASVSGADERAGGLTYGAEYRYGWLGTQLALQEDDWGANLFVSIPLNRRQYVPKLDEPSPYFPTDARASLTVAEWAEQPVALDDLQAMLHQHGFTGIRLHLDAERKRLTAELSHPRISQVGRAVGRAARILLYEGPSDLETIRIVYSANDLPLVTYRFTELQALSRFFYGLLSREKVMQTVSVSYAQPVDVARLPAEEDLWSGFEHSRKPIEVTAFDQGEVITLGNSKSEDFHWALYPVNLGTFLNDPSGAFHYDLFALGGVKYRLRRSLFLQGSLRYTWFEDISDVEQESNSRLPHVRSDIAKYKQASRFKLNDLTLNKYFHSTDRIYTRLSVGYYEEMFGGFGGQVLYLPRYGNWATDVSVDFVKQRDFDGDFGFRDYETITALLALHYRIPSLGVTATARAGRFLARDNGVRFELKRRFRSGIEVGGWYTVTDGDDITSPGSPGDPYNDKGVFVSIPLAPMLTKDTRGRAGLALAPWTRDVGQMVVTPNDLYTLVERRLPWQRDEYFPLTGLAR